MYPKKRPDVQLNWLETCFFEAQMATDIHLVQHEIDSGSRHHNGLEHASKILQQESIPRHETGHETGHENETRNIMASFRVPLGPSNTTQYAMPHGIHQNTNCGHENKRPGCQHVFVDRSTRHQTLNIHVFKPDPEK
jgi:hypothetical protein